MFDVVTWRLGKINQNKFIVGAGFIALDQIEGRFNRQFGVGGTCANVLSILSWLGWQTELVARIGTDFAGNFVIDELSQFGVGLSYLNRTSKESTPIVIQINKCGSDGQVNHTFSFRCPDCGYRHSRSSSPILKQIEQFILNQRNPDFYFFDRVTPATIKLGIWARKIGSIVIFEPNEINYTPIFQQALSISDIVKISSEIVDNGFNREFLDNVYLVIETKGSEGLRARWKGNWELYPATKIEKIVDTSGAGDWCTAGLLHYLNYRGIVNLNQISQKILGSALNHAQILSGLNCGFLGARGLMEVFSVKSLETLVNSIREKGYVVNIPRLNKSAKQKFERKVFCLSCIESCVK